MTRPPPHPVPRMGPSEGQTRAELPTLGPLHGAMVLPKHLDEAQGELLGEGWSVGAAFPRWGAPEK